MPMSEAIVIGTAGVRALSPSASTTSAARRLMGAGAAGVCSAVLGVAAVLTPDPSGVGTHSQAGLPACPWIAFMDLPCPTCGMTTAFAHAADGNLLAAFHAQPLGGMLALATAAGLLIGLYVAATGSRVASLPARLWSGRTAWWLGAFAAAAWVYKMLSFRGVLG